MSYTIVMPESHQGWLEERAKGIGSSEAGTLMGVSPFQTPYALWMRKRGQADATPESDAMFNGHVLEPAVAEWFAKKTGAVVDITSEGDWLAVDTERPYLRVSPDRLYWDQGTPEAEMTYANAHILEIKTTSKAVDKNDLPDYWYCQIQYQMGVMGIESGCLCWLTGSPNLHFDYAEVPFNRPFFETLTKKIETFWNDCVLGGQAPDDICGDDTLLRHPVAKKGTWRRADDDTYRAWLSLKDCREEIKALEKREDTLLNTLKTATKDAERICRIDTETGEMTTLATWKNNLSEQFNENTFRDEHPDLWEKYLVKTMSEKFDCKALKKDEPKLYPHYVTTLTGSRKFLVK